MFSFIVAVAVPSAAEPVYEQWASEETPSPSAVTNPCAKEIGKARDVCKQKSKRDSVVDYILLGSTSTRCEYVVYKPTAYERCRPVRVSCNTLVEDIIDKATRLSTWYSAQSVASLCEREHADACSILTNRCAVHIFVPVEIRGNARATLAPPPSEIGFYVKQPIWSFLFPTGQ